MWRNLQMSAGRVHARLLRGEAGSPFTPSRWPDPLALDLVHEIREAGPRYLRQALKVQRGHAVEAWSSSPE
eukprot:4225277-Alexandrium_andersonii.AAC.1